MFKLIIILMATVLLTGCLEEGMGLGSSSGSGVIGSSGSSGSSGSNPASGSHHATPEPSTLALLGVGLAGLAFAAIRKRKKAN